MSQNLVTLATYRLPALQTRSMADVIGKYRARLQWRRGHYSIAYEDAPSEDAVLAMDQRICELQAGLAPIDREEAARMVAGLFLCYPNMRTAGEDEAKQITAMYVARLLAFPSWAVRKAFSDITSHGNSSRAAAFVPSAEEVAAACRKQILPFTAELGDLLRIRNAAIEAPGQSPEQRAAMQRRFNGLVAELAANVKPEGPKPYSKMSCEEAEANLARIKADAILWRAAE